MCVAFAKLKKFGFPESLDHPGYHGAKKFRKNPDSGKKPDSTFFRIFLEMDSLRNSVIIKCFLFFNITIFRAAMAF